MTKGRQGVEISAAISRSAIESPAVRKTDRLTSVQRSANDPVVFGCAAVIAVIGFTRYTGRDRRSRPPRRMNISSSSRLSISVQTKAIKKNAIPIKNHARMTASMPNDCTLRACLQSS